MNDESSCRKAKILIIDNEKDVCELLKSFLEKTKKYEAWATTDPIEGIRLAQDAHPDLILLDIIMPEMDGTEVARRLSDDPATKNIIIVFVSVLANQEEIEDKKGVIGGHPFIPKPLEMKLLTARIDALLRENRIMRGDEEHPAASMPPIKNSFFSDLKFLLKFKLLVLKNSFLPARKRPTPHIF